MRENPYYIHKWWIRLCRSGSKNIGTKIDNICTGSKTVPKQAQHLSVLKVSVSCNIRCQFDPKDQN